MNASVGGKAGGIGDIVDLERYPIQDLDSTAGKALVARCRQAFADDVSCALPGFIRASAVDALVADVESRENRAFLSSRYRSAYGFYKPKHGLTSGARGPDEPHAAPQRRHVHYLAYDEFDEDSLLHRLYEAPQLARFTAAILEISAIYPAADKLMAAPVTLHYRGSELGWHCDTQEFTITTMFRPSERGGEFQYVPNVGPGDENYARVPEIFEGDRTGVRTVPFDAGDIILFRGSNTLHRVTQTESDRPRLLSVFHFERTPGHVFDDQFKLDVFGRTGISKSD